MIRFPSGQAPGSQSIRVIKYRFCRIPGTDLFFFIIPYTYRKLCPNRPVKINIRFSNGRCILSDKLAFAFILFVILADRELFRQALSRASILSNEKYRGIRLNLEKNNLKIQAHNPEQEEADEEFEVDYQGAGLEIGFNVTYLLDVLATVRSDQVEMTLNDSNSSCLIRQPGTDQYRYVVMPMRL